MHVIFLHIYSEKLYEGFNAESHLLSLHLSVCRCVCVAIIASTAMGFGILINIATI